MLSVMQAFQDMTIDESTQLCVDSINNGAKITISIVCKDANNDDIVVTDDDLLMGNSFETYAMFNPGEDLQYGNVTSTETRIKLIKNSKTEQIDWTKMIEVYFDVPTSAGTGRVLFGQYYGDVPNKVTQLGISTYEYVGYDVISTLDVPADDFLESLTYPISYGNFVNALSSYLGITINEQVILYIGLSVPSNVFYKGCTFREVLHWLAEMNAESVVTQGKDIYIRAFNTTPVFNPVTYTITPDHYYSIVKNEYTVPKPPAVKYESTTNPSKSFSYPSTYTGVPYTITDNPIIEGMDAATIEIIVKRIYNTAFLYDDPLTPEPRFIPTSVNAIGNPFIQPGDTIWVEDLHGVTDALRVFTYRFTYGEGTKCFYECTGSVSRQSKNYNIMNAYQVNGIVSKRINDEIAKLNEYNYVDMTVVSNSRVKSFTRHKLDLLGNFANLNIYLVVKSGATQSSDWESIAKADLSNYIDDDEVVINAQVHTHVAGAAVSNVGGNTYALQTTWSGKTLYVQIFQYGTTPKDTHVRLTCMFPFKRKVQ